MPHTTTLPTLIQELASLDKPIRDAYIDSLTTDEIDDLMYNWQHWARPEQLTPDGDWNIWLILSGRGWGKALALDTPLPTLTGWTTMGDVQVGDMLFDEGGNPTKVTFITPVMHNHTCYDVVFSDGSVITADAEHQWLTWTHAARKAATRRIEVPQKYKPQLAHCNPLIVTTEQIKKTLLQGKRGDINHSIDTCKPLRCPSTDLPIDPYVLGVWLGDGSSACAEITGIDLEILLEIEQAGYAVKPQKIYEGKTPRYGIGYKPHQSNPITGKRMANGSLHSTLKSLGLLHNKHVPEIYLRASVEQRLALLQGMMDTDGSVQIGGHCEFLCCRKSLSNAVYDLCGSLGIKATIANERATLYGKDCGPRYRVSFTPYMPVFRLPRKLERQHQGKAQRARQLRRYIVDVRERSSVPVRCIQVDSASHLFLAGRSYIATHNTRTLAEDFKAYGLANPNSRMAIVAPTYADARDTCVEGESGLLRILKDKDVKAWNRSLGELVLANGARYKLFSSEEPERLRGPQHHRAWCEELCLAEGTFIETEKGKVPIEQIREGNRVWTRVGLKRVKRSWCSNMNAQVYELRTNDGHALVGTANHPIWVEGSGFMPLSSLQYGCIIKTWENIKYRQVSSGVVAVGGSKINTIATEEDNCYTEPSMLQRMGQSRQDLISIIRMETKQTTIYPTLKPSIARNMLNDICHAALLLGINQEDSVKHGVSGMRRSHTQRHVKSVENHSRQQGQEQNTVHKNVAQHSILTEIKSKTAKSICVSNAGRFLLHLEKMLVSVHKHASIGIRTRKILICKKRGENIEHVLRVVNHSMRKTLVRFAALVHVDMLIRIGEKKQKRVRASIAKKSFPLILHRKAFSALSLVATIIDTRTTQSNTQNSVSVISVRPLTEKMAVFNLEVEDCHEYFANGILTHNCAWKYPQETWDNLMFGLRLGIDPRVVISTTPKKIKLLLNLMERVGKTVHLTKGSTFDNAANLAGAALDELKRRYLGTRTGRQELFAEIIDDIDGALWKRDWIERNRVVKHPELVRIVVAIDPPATSLATSDDPAEAGIVVAGLGTDGHGYMLADCSLIGTPNEWATAALTAYGLYEGDAVLGEINNGGEMIETIIRNIAKVKGLEHVPFISVRATRGKQLRAEPISDLYQRDLIHHVGTFPDCEDQMCNWVPGQRSPDRLDANVWAFTELMTNAIAEGGMVMVPVEEEDTGLGWF